MNCASDVIISKDMRVQSWHLKEKSNFEREVAITEVVRILSMSKFIVHRLPQ
jgi:hypothetical protein